MGIKALWLELSLCWELTRLDAGVDRGLSTNGNDEEEADESLAGAFDKVSIGGL